MEKLIITDIQTIYTFLEALDLSWEKRGELVALLHKFDVISEIDKAIEYEEECIEDYNEKEELDVEEIDFHDMHHEELARLNELKRNILTIKDYKERLSWNFNK